jgi:hypothetical protein
MGNVCARRNAPTGANHDDDDRIRHIVMQLLREAESNMRTVQQDHYVDHIEQAHRQAHSGEVTMHRFRVHSMGSGTSTSSSSSQSVTRATTESNHPQADFCSRARQARAGSTELVACWRRLVRQLLRLRFHQRLWGNLGQFLQLYPQPIRRAVQRQFPKIK